MPAIRPDVERSIRVSLTDLDVEIVDLEGYVCCPAFGTFASMDEDAQLSSNAWNFSLAEERPGFPSRFVGIAHYIVGKERTGVDSMQAGNGVALKLVPPPASA